MQSYIVRDVMSKPAITIQWGATVLDAAERMETHGVRRLPVVDDDEMVIGILSTGDVREATSVYSTISPYAPDQDEILLAVDEVMTSPAFTVSLTDTLDKVVQIMVDNKVGGIPVVDEKGRALGMITEYDIFRLLLQHWQTGD